MRVNTSQELTFIDGLIEAPASELDILDELVNWSKIKKKLGWLKGDYDSISLFKMMLLQTWHNMSDVAVTNAVSRDLVYMKFCGFSLEGKKPDASTLCRFRNKLVDKNILDRLLLIVNQSIESQGLKVSDGKYVSSDATLIQSSRRPKKKFSSHGLFNGTYEVDEVEYSDDKDAAWTNKSGKYTYGYSSTVTTDEHGLVLSTNTHPANKSEMTRFEEDIKSANLKPGQKVLYDKGASSKVNQEFLKQQKLQDGIMRKKPRGKDMSHWNKLRNKLISSRRFVTERTFGTLKRTYGLSRTRYIGIAKVNAEVLVKSMAYNLKRAINLYKQSADYCVQN